MTNNSFIKGLIQKWLLFYLKGVFVPRKDRFGTGYVLDDHKSSVTFYVKGERTLILSRGFLSLLKEVIDG
jgi:hypothetical protein